MDLFSAIAAELPEVTQERMAIREYDGGLTRAEAERLGALDGKAWQTACLVRHAQAMAPSQLDGFVLDMRKHHGDAGVVRLVAALEPYATRQRLVDVLRKKYGGDCANAVIAGLKREREKKLQEAAHGG